MGEIINAGCPVCGHKKELYIGGGISDCNFDTILSSFPDEVKRSLTAAKNGGAENFSIDRKLCVCGVCGNIYSSAEVSYRTGGHEKKIFDNCPVCGSSHKIFYAENSDYRLHCPKCGNEIRLEKTGFWD